MYVCDCFIIECFDTNTNSMNVNDQSKSVPKQLLLVQNVTTF